MHSKILFLMALGVAVMCGNAFATEPSPTRFTSEARLSLDAAGNVTAVRFVNSKAENELIGQRLEAVIRGWKFESGTVNGQPMPTETSLFVDLESSSDGKGGYTIHVLDARTGMGRLKGAATPSYPRDELADMREAVLSLVMTVNDSGAPSDVSVSQIDTNGRKKAFEDAAIDAARQWRFQPEFVGGHAVAARIQTSVTFCVKEASGNTPCARDRKKAAANASAVPPQEDVTLDSQAKLVTLVADTSY